LQDTAINPKAKQPDFLSPRDLAQLLGVREETAVRWMRAGVVPNARRIGGVWRCRRTDIEAMFSGDRDPGLRGDR